MVTAVAGLVFASLIWLPVTRRWTARAHLCWATSIFLFVVYLAYVLRVDLRQPSRAGQHRRRPAAVAASRSSPRCCPALTCGRSATRSARRHWRRRIAPTTAAARAVQRAADDQPARAGAQRAAGHGHRHAALAAPHGLPALRGHPDRRQHRRRGPVAAGRGLVRSAQGQVRPPGELARLQVRSAELRAARAGHAARRGDRRGGFRLPDQARVPARSCAPAFADPWIGFVQTPQDYRGWQHARVLPAAVLTPTGTSSRSPSPPATSTTGRSSPARWG